MREDRKKVRDPEGSEKRDGRRSLAVRDVGLIRHARNGDLDSIKQMIKEGANINEQDETGWTVLHEACVRNLPRIVDYLLRHGANSGLANVNGDTALHCAARVGCLRIVRALLYYNADPILSNHKGEKPLDLCHDSEVSSFLKQHTEANQSHMLTSSNSGKSSHSKVRHHTHGTKHLMSSFSGSTVSSCNEYYSGGKDNNSITSPSDVYSDSDDDSHSNSGLSITTMNIPHHNISPTTTNQQVDSNNCLPSSSPSLSSVPKCMSDTHPSSAKSLKKDPYAFEDDESDDAVNNPGNSLLHPSTGANNNNISNNTNTQTGHIGVHSGCGVIGSVNLNKPSTSNILATTPITTNTGTVNTNTTTSPNSNISNIGGSSLVSKHTRQLSSSNLSTVDCLNNITLDSNNNYSNHSSCGNNNNNSNTSVGGPPLRLRFAKEAGQYTLMEQQQQQQQQQADLSVSNCDNINLIPSSIGISCTVIEAPHVTVINDKNDYMETNNVDNVSNEHDSNVGLPVSVKGEPSAVTSEVLEHISTSCHSESSGGEELSSQKVPPLRIKFASGTSGDESSSMTSSSTSAGVAGSGFTVHSTNISENNIASDELDRSDRCDVKPRVSVNGLMNVNSKSDSNEAVVVVVTSPVSTIVTNSSVVSSSILVQEKIPCSSVESNNNNICSTETVHDHQHSSHNSKSLKYHGHVVATNIHHDDMSSSFSTCSPPPFSTCSTSALTTNVNPTSDNGTDTSISRSNASNSNRVKADTTIETSGCHANSANSNSNNHRNATTTTSTATTSANTTTNNNNSNRETAKDSHRHRSGRTLRSHTAAQREKEEKERHTDDTTPIKKRKLRSRSDAATSQENNSQHSRSGINVVGITTGHANNSPVTTHSGSASSSNMLSSSNSVVNMDVVEDTHSSSTATTSQSEVHLTSEEKKPLSVVTNSHSMVNNDKDTDVHMTCVSEMEVRQSVSSANNNSSNNNNSNNMDVDVKPEVCGSPASVATHGADASNNSLDAAPPPVSAATTVLSTGTPFSSSSSSSAVEQSGRHGDQSDCDMGYLFCPAAPGDEDRKDIELLKFQNPYEKAAELSKSLRELVDNLVKVHPKAPCGYQDYLLVTRNYLLANQLSLATYVKRSPPAHLEATFVELFNEQEEERYAQALKHQSEREHLQLGAEQAVLRAQTRGALAVANQSKPYSFCSILSYNDLTYIPPVGKLENREEENVRDRFTPRTFIGWLQDIIDTFQNEKKKLLCRQLHEAESLMMVQKLDWEMKTRETLSANIDCIGVAVDIFKDIPSSYVPLIPVPNDFPLFAHDPVHRTTVATISSSAAAGAASVAPAVVTMASSTTLTTPISSTTSSNTVNTSITLITGPTN
ncbi:Ankyrin repeat domain-containing protein 12 [Schistosoma japonicum]|nr:Ankyrin repeat domain-containing protein 12 [Schistosoma japonicum]